jgi:hypothetical protein
MKKGYLIALIVLTALTLLSLMLNGAVIYVLLQGQQIALNTVNDARAVVTNVNDATISYTIEVDQEIPVAASVPFYEVVSVPINTVLPVETTVMVPINLGVISYSLEVPISTIIPVDLEVTVPISQTVNVVTTVPLDLDVPIEIPLADTPLVDYVEELDAALARLEARLKHPFDRKD